MPRPRRADEAGGIYHALNRGNRRATIFHTQEDYWAFENILSSTPTSTGTLYWRHRI